MALLNYISTNTKARVLYGRLLSMEDYNNLLEKRTVREVAAYLKKHTYCKEIFGQVNENNIHRSELEVLLKVSLYDDFAKLLKHLRGNAKKYLQAAFLRHEIEDLKVLLRRVSVQKSGSNPDYLLSFLNDLSSLDYYKLAGSKDITEFIYNLRDTQYYRALRTFADNKERQNLFDMEKALDLHYYSNIMDLKNKLLGSSDNKAVTRIYGTEIDIMNLMLIYRCKKLFNLPKELTLNRIVPYWCYLSRKKLVELAECRDVQEFRESVSNTRYSFIFKVEKEQLWEINAKTYLYNFYRRILKRGKFSMGSIIAYIHLKEFDISNIITIIEGVRYQLPPEEIKSYLIGIKGQ
ncbi:MAG TPA: V-type ATPase subunit [Clostridiaceae bacterium]|nr:V-type ATPase subunit [Clostridiaceae bacterium]